MSDAPSASLRAIRFAEISRRRLRRRSRSDGSGHERPGRMLRADLRPGPHVSDRHEDVEADVGLAAVRQDPLDTGADVEARIHEIGERVVVGARNVAELDP